jgi:hypothetical protein
MNSKTTISIGKVRMMLGNYEIEDLPNNRIPQGVVPLETMFNRHDMYKKPPIEDQPEDVYEINIGSKESPRIIKIGKGTVP